MPIITYQELRNTGASRAAIERMLRNGALFRVRDGWYASQDTPLDVVTAVTAGGTLTCRGALRVHGIWTTAGPSHVRVAPKGRVHGRSARIHRLPGSAIGGVDDLPTAIRVAVSCLPLEDSVCAIDSVLNRGAMSLVALEAVLDTPRGRRLLGLADGRSESGLETLARVRLRACRVKVRTQVVIPGIGRVDLVVGERLIIELDGDEWHSTAEQREKDRRRDSALTALGYLVMRAGYSRVMDDWKSFEQEVLAVVRRREHYWRFVHRVGPGAALSRSQR